MCLRAPPFRFPEESFVPGETTWISTATSHYTRKGAIVGRADWDAWTASGPLLTSVLETAGRSLADAMHGQVSLIWTANGVITFAGATMTQTALDAIDYDLSGMPRVVAGVTTVAGGRTEVLWTRRGASEQSVRVRLVNGSHWTILVPPGTVGVVTPPVPECLRDFRARSDRGGGAMIDYLALATTSGSQLSWTASTFFPDENGGFLIPLFDD